MINDAVRCTRVAGMAVEAHVPPLRLGQELLSLMSGVKTARRDINHPAWCQLLQYEQLVQSGARPMAVRLHFLCAQIN